MQRIVLVSREPADALAMAVAWVAAGPATVVLLDGAAAVARRGHPQRQSVTDAIDAGVVVAVHDEAAVRRGMTPADLVDGVKTVDLDEVADLVADSSGPVVWL